MKTNTYLILAISLILSIGLASAEICNLQVSLLNQDPYPAVQGDYVKLVFQVTGAQNPECKNINFQLVPQYPISFDPNVSSEVNFNGGTFVNDYSSNLLVPFKVRVDENAIDGDNPIEIRYSNGGSSINSSSITTPFNLNVKDVKTTFEAYVKNFDPSTNIMTVQVLNSGKSGIDALTIEIPQQESIVVKGSNKNIVGSLDASEYTTADFEIVPANKTTIFLNLYYTDKIGVRRQTNTTVSFDPTAFSGLKSQQTSSSTWIYIVAIIVLIIIYIFYKRYKKNQKKKLHS
jgi:hypothetical protein